MGLCGVLIIKEQGQKWLSKLYYQLFVAAIYLNQTIESQMKNKQVRQILVEEFNEFQDKEVEFPYISYMKTILHLLRLRVVEKPYSIANIPIQIYQFQISVQI
ncbi:Hypothetical_protein [Hexamita inflata]|uniref:Hypothetical_protein n=1 Tax=Hexamita inflata TaxID=28002 RepID=A0AA86Q6C0_9EUKA|nr:Hypothetical protein HINF_LOCUS40775 [Hexamita inflata]